MKHWRLSAFIGGLLLCASSFAQEADPFGFLEDESDPRTAAFFQEQGESTRAILDRIPGREALAARIRALSRTGTTVSKLAWGGSRIFYLRLDARGSTPALCMRETPAAPEKVLLDPARFDRGGERASIDWIAPSPDGRHVALGLALAGSEDAVLRVLAVDGTPRLLPLEIDRARFNRELAWHPDSRAFYYARIPEGNTGIRRYANVRVYRHVLGRATDQDEVVFAAGVGGARDVPEFVYPSLHVPLESKYAYAVVREGVRREIAVHVTEQRELAAGKPRWRKLIGTADEVLAVEGWKDDLFVLSRRNAPRHRVLRVKASAHDLSVARLMVPEGDSVIRSVGLARDALYLRTMVAGVDRLERMAVGLLGPKPPEFVRIPFDNAIVELLANPRHDGALLRLEGWIEPPTVMQVDRRGDARKTPIVPPGAAEFGEMDEVRLYAPSHDGTRIPVTLVYRKSTRLGGDNPTLLMAYGSYGIPFSPTFDATRLAWLERGGVIAVAHVRGGGEYGELWHQAGRRGAKLNTILDTIAAAEFIVSYGFTGPRRLALMGTGAGGIPVGGALVRRPELFAAVVARVPVMDMLRAELAPNGPANIPEFGTATTPEGREWLRTISAYHHVKDDTPYPAVLLTTGLRDPRVAPWQAAKMAARLQQASASNRPVLLRVDADAGHGIGTAREQREAELADLYSFLLWQMGEEGFRIPPVEGGAAPGPGVAR